MVAGTYPLNLYPRNFIVEKPPDFCCENDVISLIKDSYHLQSYIDGNLLALGKKFKGPIRLQGSLYTAV